MTRSIVRRRLGMDTETLRLAPKAIRLAVARALIEELEKAGRDIGRASATGGVLCRIVPTSEGSHHRHPSNTEYSSVCHLHNTVSRCAHAAVRSRDGQSVAMHDATARSPTTLQREQYATITGTSAYTGSPTANASTRLPPMIMLATGVVATRALSSKGRVSSTYAASFCSKGETRAMIWSTSSAGVRAAAASLR